MDKDFPYDKSTNNNNSIIKHKNGASEDDKQSK